jgi:hypothetical protein
MFRLAISSVEHAPAVAGILDQQALRPNACALRELMATGVRADVLGGEPARLATLKALQIMRTQSTPHP